MVVDQGEGGVVPFQFQCQRSGRCCTGGSGFIWVEPEEIEGLARAAGYTLENFEANFLREVRDPRTGAQRLSLREGPGQGGGGGAACALLEGSHHCTVYDARPSHCQTFPYWPSIMKDEQGFEAARATCPGIRPLPSAEVQAQAFAQLEQLYLDLDKEIAEHTPRCEMSGLCCRFEEADHVLYATALETDYATAKHPTAPAPEAPGRCPHHVNGMCTAREGRPLGCRTYYCDPLTEDVLLDVHEKYLRRLRGIERSLDYPAAYSPFPAQLAARGVGESP
jgi:Fe-S-cluster containining protein